MAGSILFEEQVEIPLDIRSLDDFRRWAHSPDFPERGRIDYINGRVEVDMSPEDFYLHGTPKGEIYRALANRVKRHRLGDIVTDCTRVSSVAANLSAEPDILFVSRKALEDGRVRLIEKATGEPGRYIEVEGAPDLIVEIVSDSSVAKDTVRLPKAYFAAGVKEFWLVDARGEELLFRIHRRGPSAFEPVDVDEEGYQRSEVFGCRYRFERTREESGRLEYDLLEKD